MMTDTGNIQNYKTILDEYRRIHARYPYPSSTERGAADILIRVIQTEYLRLTNVYGMTTDRIQERKDSVVRMCRAIMAWSIIHPLGGYQIHPSVLVDISFYIGCDDDRRAREARCCSIM